MAAQKKENEREKQKTNCCESRLNLRSILLLLFDNFSETVDPVHRFFALRDNMVVTIWGQEPRNKNKQGRVLYSETVARSLLQVGEKERNLSSRALLVRRYFGGKLLHLTHR